MLAVMTSLTACNASSPKTDPTPPGACNQLAAAGTWESISPPAVSLEATFKTPAGDNFGDHSFAIDPQNSAIVYLGTSAQGIYKSTDCGSTWTHINTGRNAAELDGGRQWNFLIDPIDPNVLYTNSGYGTAAAYKSTNGGVDWDLFVDPAYSKALQFGSFVHMITLDPSDHLHLIVTPHFACDPGQGPGGLPKTDRCLLETKDAGATWRIVENTPSAGEGQGQWMVDSMTWFWAASFDGLWRTTNGGVSWDHVYTGGYATMGWFSPDHNAHLYTGGVFNVLGSTDGNTWTQIDKSPGIEWVTGDATTLYGSRNGFYQTASVSDPTAWTMLPTPFSDPANVLGWGLKYDADHHLLYSLNSRSGFWRMVTR